MMINIEERALGGFLGLACGDALGSVVEFCPRGSFRPLTDMRSGGKFRLPKGHWTDDTSMAICLAESLVAKPEFDPLDQMNRYYEWADTGKNSSLPHTFGIGKQVAFMLGEFKRTGNPYTPRTDAKYSGNGSLMRLMPVILRYHQNHENVLKYAELSSKTTHATSEAIQSCQYFSTLILRIFQGLTKDQLFQDKDALTFDKLTHICLGEFKNKKSDDVGSIGYVVDSLEVALWAFWHTDNFKDAVLMAANLGDDADTNASICGQIAGAYYGVKNIPDSWLDCLYRKNDIEKLTLELLKMRDENMITVYGIKNCDTVKKALKWLADHNIEHKLHDYRVDGLDNAFLQQAEAQFGWENLVNKRSTTWRNLDEDVKKTLSKATALSVLAENPTLIKRPIILQEGKALIGFDEKEYQAVFA